MNIELKDFQESSVRGLLKALGNAKREAADGTAQAIALSSPTGSGKTITVAALLERVLRFVSERLSRCGDVAIAMADVAGTVLCRDLGLDAPAKIQGER